jgi:hypothetical protein
MITTAYRVTFPPDVTLRDNSLYDSALDQAYSLNNTAAFYLTLLRACEPMPAVVAAVSNRFNIPPEAAERDLLGLVARLNAAHLLNVSPRGVVDRLKRLLLVAAFVLTVRDFPPLLVKRGYVATGGPMRISLSVSHALAVHLLPAVLIAALIIGALALLTAPVIVSLLASALAAAFVAIILHEIGHAVAVHMVGGRSYLLMAGIKIGVAHVHASSPAVHVAGPLFAGMVGLAALLAAYVFNSSILAVTSFPFILHLASLTVAARDGKLLMVSLAPDKRQERE